jgi:NitT/TauT family transport system ATP-binding protein
MAGLLRPQAGEVLLDGVQLGGPDAGISVILQEYGLFPWKTVSANVALPLLLKKEPPRQIMPQVGEVLDRLGLREFQGKFPGQLSGGQRQRVAIARALISRPRLLLMDEPFSALDALTREGLQHTLRELCAREILTLVLVTHNIEEAAYLGEKILILQAGCPPVVRENPEALAENYRDTAAYDDCCRLLRRGLREP